MSRRPTLRLGALGLIALMQVGVFSHLQHALCVTEVASASPTEHAAPVKDHHAHHAQAADADEPARDQSDGHGSTHLGSCNLCCPDGKREISFPVEAARAGEVVHFGRVAVASIEVLASPTAYLLPLPNPPPTV